MSVKESADKPGIGDFSLGASLGEGNFSRIVRATHRATGEAFALKTIEKTRVKRLRIRHPNIFNEINMEKDVLNQLRHPNIIRLYHTFQDNVNLYFLLEVLDGGELLEQLLFEGRQMALHEELARFYLADVVNAVEYMHASHILHRDLKPENMVVCKGDGHIRLIDFGTAKNLANTALNGPNFVGTPEYMPPEVIDNKEATAASDLWAIGCIMYQLLTGETPFSGGSAYLTFLRVQDGNVHVPEFISEDACDLITNLLQPDPMKRPDIHQIKAHPFFKGVDFANHMTATKPSVQFCGGPELFTLVKDLEQFEKARQRASRSIEFEPTDMIQAKICALDPREKSLLMHILKRKQMLHLPGIYSRFFATAAQGRCRYATDHKYVGLSHDLQNQWNDNFSFMQLSGPCLGSAAALTEMDSRGGSTWESEAREFRQAIATVNRKRPAFVAILGKFVNASPDQYCYQDQVGAFQNLVNEIDADIRLVLVPGPDSVSSPDCSTPGLTTYESNFGDSWFSFWFGGMKFIVLNSSFLCHSGRFIEQAARQEEWLKKELENGKLCARGTAVLTYHSLRGAVDSKTQATNESLANNEETAVLPTETRERYFEMISKAQACLVVSAGADCDEVSSVVTNIPRQSGEGEDEFKCDLIRCQSPWSTRAAVFIGKVSQSSVVIDKFQAEPIIPLRAADRSSSPIAIAPPAPVSASSKLLAVPEDQEHEQSTTATLEAEVVAINLMS